MPQKQRPADKVTKSLTPLQRQTLLWAIHAQLPQTQCTRCGYLNCEGYAQAIVDNQTQINRCQPGGKQGIKRLAKVTQRPVIPLDPEVGTETPRVLAVVDEAWCIGCTKCIQACPVDAIVGAPKHMHVVLEEHCTGCELCTPVCPVDCIELHPTSAEHPAPMGWAAWSAEQAKNAQNRYAFHRFRLERQQQESQKRKFFERPRKLDSMDGVSKRSDPYSPEHKHELIAKVLAKAKKQFSSK